MLALAKCTIISSRSNAFLDSYVLSESSLFVYRQKLLVKTCGTTVLLEMLPALLSVAAQLALHPELVLYSRKNLQFPQAQQPPHRHFRDEVAALQQLFPDGDAHVLGALTDEHVLLFSADYKQVS